MGIIITQSVALICNTYIAFTKKNRNVYIASTLFNIFAMLTGLLQQDYGLCVSYLIIIYRSYTLLVKDKINERTKLFPLTFVVAHIVFGFATWSSVWDIIPIVTPILTGLVMWYVDNLQVYRVNNIVNNTMWLIHNLHSGSYILAVTRVYSILVNIVSICSNAFNKTGVTIECDGEEER